MSALIHPKTITVDGLSIRYAEGGQDGPDAILMSPWPESVFAFEPTWPHLAAAAHLVAIDPPGFGGSDYRQTLMNPKAMGHFILKVADSLGLDNPHVVAPDIGTSSVLFATAADQDRFRSIVVGSGGVAVPLDVTGVLLDSASCRYTNRVLSYPTPAFLKTLKAAGISFEDAVADRQAASDDHNRRETALYAQSLERKALARN
jgi:pimeloyl-ACP methyl ester carboxylesterase